jgi:hypothetical protein
MTIFLTEFIPQLSMFNLYISVLLFIFIEIGQYALVFLQNYNFLTVS